MKISAQKGYSLTEQERLELSRLLIKAGYVVSLSKEKTQGKSVYTHYINFEKQEE